MRYDLLKRYVRDLVVEMSTRYKRETGQNFPKWEENFEKYVQQGDLFVHFSYFPKFGLNPLNEYDTPTAFYAYPMNHEKFSSFAIDRPYAIIFRPKNPDAILNLSTYTEDDFQNDVEALKRMPIGAKITDEQINDISDDANVQSPGGYFWNLTRTLPRVAGKKHEKYLKNPGYGDREIERNKLKFIAARWVEKTKAKTKEEAYRLFYEKVNEYSRFFGKREQDIKDKSELDALYGAYNDYLLVTEYIDGKGGDSWIQPNKALLNTIKHMDISKKIPDLDREVAKASEYDVNETSSSWTQIIRSLGYEGVYDDGDAIIHRNEPWQGAFFSVGDLEIVDILYKAKDIAPNSDPSAIKDLTKRSTGGLVGSKFERKSLRHEDWNGVNLSDSSFDTSRLMGVKLNGANLSGCEFIATGFTDVEANSAKFDSSRFVELDFRTSNFTRASFTGVTFENISFKSANFSGANFSRAEFSESFFDGCEFRGANFSGAFLQDVTFYVDNFTQLETINFSGTSFENCRFSDRKGAVLKKFDSWTNSNNQTLGVDADGNFFQK